MMETTLQGIIDHALWGIGNTLSGGYTTSDLE